MNSLSQIAQDSSLWGHGLYSLPDRILKFSRGPFCLYPRPAPGTYPKIINDGYLFTRITCITKQHSNGRKATEITQTFVPGQKLISDGVECVARRILGRLAGMIASFSLRPIGFMIKAAHFHAREIIGQARPASFPFTAT